MAKINHIKPTSLEVVDEISYHVALVEVERSKARDSDVAWSHQLGKQLEAQLAELRRHLLPAPAALEKASPIRAALFGIDRPELLARLSQLVVRMGGAIQYAHRDLRGLSDDDLRRLLDLLEPDDVD
jgi:hypothetical protein